MHKPFFEQLRCPKTLSKLKLIGDHLENDTGEQYQIIDDIPSMVIITNEAKNNLALNTYKHLATEYDKYHYLNFETFFLNEENVRNSMIDKLRLDANSRVLELNAGTGRDSVLIAKRLSSQGELHVQDISLDMLFVLKDKFKNNQTPLYITQSNTAKLPYPNKHFDAIYGFSGVALSRYDGVDFFKEIARVIKPGGRVVLGGHSIAPWLRTTDFAKILINQNETYASEFDLSAIPVEARDLSVTWIMSGAVFVVDFTMGEGEPQANFDYEIPGARGGTYLTRYYGKLEGVTPETKELALKAREKLGISMHKWLDNLIRQEAEKILNPKKEK
ncbi:methyltransferase domain-containing protein [Oxalobacter sp. OttesenSCG-928-P03]|nr:methyltransferase domain-containing protein [Oxalobacter sp. OttesenSCG-928-P03]